MNFMISVSEELGALGMSISSVRDLYERAGYPVTERTLRRNVKAKKERKLERRSSNSGRSCLLSESQKALLVGHVLWQNQNKDRVFRKTGVDFVKGQFLLDVSVMTIGRYFAEAGLVQRRAHTRSCGYTSTDEQAQLYVDFINGLDREIKKGNKIIASIDFTYDSLGTVPKSTYSAKGANQPCIDVKKSPFTNCYVTLIYSDGSQSPCFMYTYNQKFLRKSGNSNRARRHNKKLADLFAKYGIKSHRVKVIQPKKGKSTKYAKEDNTMATDILKQYDVPTDTIHSDNGTAFMRGGVDVVEELGFTRFTAPACIHQYVSPNDNHFHGAAKQAWRMMGDDYSDALQRPLQLMQCFDKVEPAVIKGYFDRNFFLDQRPVSKEEVGKLFGSSVEQRPVYFRRCLLKYRREILNEDIEEVEEVKGLDGIYWN